MVKPYVIHPGEAVEVQKTFTPVCSNCRVTLECQYQNSHTGYSIVYAEDQPPGPQSSAQSVKFKNPFVGTLKSNEIVLEVTNEIDAGITEKYKDLRLALLAPCCNAEGAKKAIEQWRMLECACFDDELWKLSFAEGIDLEVREGLWLYLVESLGSGRGYEGFDDLLLHAGILLTQDELKESATRLFVTLAESGTVTVKVHSLLWRCSKSMQKKAMDILDSLGVRYRTPDSKADSIQPGTAPAAATEPAAVSATPARELAPASSSMTEETPAPVVQQDDRCIYLFVVVGASAIIIAAFVVLKRKR
jgi:hypothetical protein